MLHCSGPRHYIFNKLQKLLNIGCRLIFGLRKNDHITKHLNELHWLRIESKVQYKVVMLVFKAIHGLTPTYLSEFFIEPKRKLRSSTRGNLFQSRAKNSKFLKSSFQIAGTKLWNELPENLRAVDSLEVFRTSENASFSTTNCLSKTVSYVRFLFLYLIFKFLTVIFTRILLSAIDVLCLVNVRYTSE